MPEKLRSSFIVVAAACCCCLLTGCFELRQTLAFQGRDDCTMSWSYRFPDKYSAALLQCERRLAAEHGDFARPPRIMVMNRDSWEAWVKRHPDLELLQFASYAADGQRRVQVVVACAHAMRNLNQGVFGDISLQRNPLGDMSCTISLPSLRERSGTGTETGEATKGEEAGEGSGASAWERHLRGMRLTYVAAVPTAILRTNGRKEDFNRCSWEWDFSREPPLVPGSRRLTFAW